MSTNFAIFGLGFVGFFLIGYGVDVRRLQLPGGLRPRLVDRWTAVGSGSWVFLWHGGFALTNLHGLKNAAPAAAMFLYMVAFMDTTATIPTGAMAERWKWKAFVGWGLFCGAIYYPIFGAWTWGGGWLSQLGNSMKLGFGYVDFAGSGVVHAIGGVAGLAGALVLGARIGKYGADGKPRTLAAHSIPMAMLGTFILLFGWFGFNAASTFAATDVRFAVVAANTATRSCVRCHGGDVLRDEADGQARPRHDGQRHARRSRGDHRSVRLRAAVGGGGHRFARGDHRRRVGVLLRAQGHRRPGGCDLGARSRAASSASSASGSSRSGEYGAGWNLTTKGAAATASGVTGILYDFDLGARQLGAQAVGALVICTVIFGIALRRSSRSRTR